MIFTKYSFPLPNEEDHYRFTSEELIQLLDTVYNSGFENARDIYDPVRQGKLTWASSEDVDDNTKWKEVWIK